MRCLAETCGNWTGMGCVCEVMDLDPVNMSEPDSAFTDPCDFCPHGRPDHGGDGCRACGCAVPA